VAAEERVNPVYRQDMNDRIVLSPRTTDLIRMVRAAQLLRAFPFIQCPAILSGVPAVMRVRMPVARLQKTAVSYSVRFRLLNCTEIHKANSKEK